MRKSDKLYNFPAFFTFFIILTIASNFANPFNPAYMVALKQSDYMFGLINALASLGVLIMSPLWGILCDYFGRTKIIAIGCLGGALGQFIFSRSITPFFLLSSRTLTGVFSAGYQVAMLIYLLDMCNGVGDNSNIANHAVFQSVSAAFAYIIGGAIANSNIRRGFNCQVVLLCLMGLYALFIMPESSYRREHKSFKKSLCHSLDFFGYMLHFRRYKITPLILMLCGVILSAIGGCAFDNCFNYMLSRQFGYPPIYNGVLKCIIGILTLYINVVILNKMVSQSHRCERSLSIILLLCATLSAAVVGTNGIYLMFGVSVAFFVINSMYLPLQQVVVTNFKNKISVSAISGMFNSCRSAGFVLGSLMSGGAYTLHYKLPYLLTVVAFLAAFVFTIVGSRFTKKLTCDLAES